MALTRELVMRGVEQIEHETAHPINAPHMNGNVLAHQLVHMTGKSGEYSLVTDSMPDEAGINPLLLLVDCVPDDNMKRIDRVR